MEGSCALPPLCLRSRSAAGFFLISGEMESENNHTKKIVENFFNDNQKNVVSLSKVLG
jgi:hypothetical protein